MRHWNVTAGTIKSNFTLQRYKGLGEMDAEQLWETTLESRRRAILKRIEIEDATYGVRVSPGTFDGNMMCRRARCLFMNMQKTQHLISDRDVGVTGTTGREQTVTCGREVSSAS